MRQFWSLNKTKIMGGLVLIIQYLQLPGNSGVIEKHIGTSGLEVIGILFGIIIIIIGVVNGGTPPSQGGDGKTVTRSFALMAILAGMLVALTSLSGCTGTRAAYKAADTLDEYAYVISEQYAASVEEAANYAEENEANASAVAKLRAADDKTKPIIRGLNPLAQSWKATRDATTEQELRDALDKAVVALTDFIRVIKEVRGQPVTGSVLKLEENVRWIQSRLVLLPSAS